MRPLDPRLLRHARAARRHVGVCVVLGVVVAVLVLAQAELLSRVIAGVIGSRSYPLAAPLVALGAVLAGRAGVAWVQESAARRASAQAKSQLRHAVVRRTTEPGAVVDRAAVATLVTRGLDALDAYFGRYLPQLFLAVIVPAVVLARLFAADLIAAVIVLVTLPLIPLFMVLIGRATESANAKRWNALTRLAHHFLDVVAGLATLKAFGRAKAQAESIRRSTEQYRTTTMATLRIAFLSSLVLELVATLSVAVVAVSVGLRLVDGHLDLRTGLLVIIIAPEAYLPIRQVGAQFHAAAEGVAAADEAMALLDAPRPSRGPSPAPDVAGGVELAVRDLRVDHPGRDVAAPDGVTFVARTGELTAVAGPSGSGKTTLLGVLLATVRPTGGAVTVNGVDLVDVDPDSWWPLLAWVDQSPYVFAGTVADNVRLAAAAASDAEVRAALDAADLAVPLDRVLGERGRGLSSGERRRLAIARAVLRDAPIVLLDEPTAGLDADSERIVLDAIGRLAAGRLVVMAAHRPAAIARADRVVTLAGPVRAAEGVR